MFVDRWIIFPFVLRGSLWPISQWRCSWHVDRAATSWPKRQKLMNQSKCATYLSLIQLNALNGNQHDGVNALAFSNLKELYQPVPFLLFSFTTGRRWMPRFLFFSMFSFPLLRMTFICMHNYFFIFNTAETKIKIIRL